MSAPMTTAEQPLAPTSDQPSVGELARAGIQHQVRRLGQLHHPVLADEDPEDLHKLRVSLRRLRTALDVFAPALVVPAGVHVSRLARVARRTGLTRDLDVFRAKLEGSWLPRIPQEERQALAKTLGRLKRDRRQAFESMVEALNGGRYLKLLALLNQWQASPGYSPIGEQPLRPWLLDWVTHLSQGLFLHQGWFEDDPAAESLHALRKRIKGLRYSLEPFVPYLPPAFSDWIEEFKRAQEHLGDLHDLAVLEATLDSQSPGRKAGTLPTLHGTIAESQALHWQEWQAQAARLRGDDQRQALHRLILTL